MINSVLLETKAMGYGQVAEPCGTNCPCFAPALNHAVHSIYQGHISTELCQVFADLHAGVSGYACSNMWQS